MAALSPLPTRQPFGVVDSHRLLGLQNVKNRQNAMSCPSTSLKRTSTTRDIFEDDNSENIDPSFLASLKRSKGSDGFSKAPASSPLKPTTQFILTDAPPSPDDLTNPIKSFSAPSSTRVTRVPVSRLSKLKTPLTTSNSPAPAVGSNKAFPTLTPAGRSPPPKNKRIGILNRRRTGSSPFTRISPPKSLGQKKSSASTPLSLNAALKGTLSSYTPVSPQEIPVLEDTPKQASWFFAIHEDTAEQDMTNMMEHSASTLDISDDEGKRGEKSDRGKENIPPMGGASIEIPNSNASTMSTADIETALETSSTLHVTAPFARDAADRAALDLKPRRGAAKKAARLMKHLDAHRAPLGDLPLEEFYDEGGFILCGGEGEKVNVPRED
ncbi:MAG: hypothetical protein M1817_000612 [Caeruleum heppii]|nr:MAG: hypothetical protein M1817_000612 [Caeruleum heppii]